MKQRISLVYAESCYERMCAIEALCIQLRTQDLYAHAHVSDVLVYMYLTSCIYVICMKIRYMCLHAYTLYVHVDLNSYIHICMHAYIRVHTYIHTYIHTYTHTYIHTYMYVQCTYTHTPIHSTYKCTCTCMRVCMHVCGYIQCWVRNCIQSASITNPTLTHMRM